MATGLTVIAAVVGAVALATHPSGISLRVIPAAAAVIGGYYLAGALGGLAYFPLQRIQGVLLGQMVMAFVIGAIAYGSVGFTAAVALTCCGVNVVGYESVREAWHVWPLVTLGLAVMSAIIGPLVWRIRS